MRIIELLILLLIVKNLFIYERYRISISVKNKYFLIYTMKWDYNKCDFVSRKKILVFDLTKKKFI